MLYFSFNNVEIPLTCVTGLSYNKSGNIVPEKDHFKCTGINPVQVQVQFALNASTCVGMVDSDNGMSLSHEEFMNVARKIDSMMPNKTDKPSFIMIGDSILLPQLKFMLTSTNMTCQSDRLGNLQEIQVSWTLSGSQVVKDEARIQPLTKMDSKTGELLLPRVVLHCKGKSVECSDDINVASLQLSAFYGDISLLLSDTYKNVARKSWLVDVNNSEDTYFEIENYGLYYIHSSNTTDDNWLEFHLTKFSKDWYKKRSETFISDDKTFTLKDIFKGVEVKSKAEFEYYKYDCSPIDAIYNLQDSLGYLIGLQNNRVSGLGADKIILFDPPSMIGSGDVTYDYHPDRDTMTQPITKVVIRDGYGEYSAGDNSGETFFVNAQCRLPSGGNAERVLQYVKFNQNMITIEVPIEKRICVGSIVNVDTGDQILHCVCTEYDIDFMQNQMLLELHYVE